MSVTAYSTVAVEAIESWHPLPLPRSAMLAVVPAGMPYAGSTLARVAKRDPAALSEIVAKAPNPRLRDAARRVRGHVLIGGCR